MLFISGKPHLIRKMDCKLGLYSQKIVAYWLANLKNILHALGSGLGQILKVKISWKYFGRFDDSRPARACIEVSKSSKGVDIGIEAIDQISEEVS